jgi:hypothetical protein
MVISAEAMLRRFGPGSGGPKVPEMTNAQKAATDQETVVWCLYWWLYASGTLVMMPVTPRARSVS